ncbi:MAG: hypothetical protein IPP13_15990 [Kouleothrix sp.]|nr:hypothetical protein [Kouleothrix sp.]
MTIPKPQNATLIDSISEGYAAINRRPWIILIPVLLNLYLWFGPQLSLGPLVTSAIDTLKRAQPALADQEDIQLMYDQLLATGGVDLRQQLALLNYVPTLHLYVVGALETAGGLPAIPEVLQPINSQRADTIAVSSVGGALVSILVLNACALVLSAVFLSQVGGAVRRDWSLVLALRHTPKIGLVILSALGIVAGAGLALGLPLLFLVTLLLYLNQTLGLLALFLLYWVGVWVSIYIGFMREAIVMSGLGPLRAIYASFNVVRRNIWATLGFLLLSLIIRLGSGVIWHSLVNSRVGVIIAIIGSAYIGSGLVAARMAFYRERLRRWQSAPSQSAGLQARN